MRIIKYYLLLNEYLPKKPGRSLFFLLTLIFFSRVPFLFAGFGPDPDAWRIINSARHISHSGDYIPSRFPGYPVVEYFFSLLTGLPPFFCNLATAVFSTVGFLFFYLILSKIHSRDTYLTVLGLALLPVIYVNSVSTMDYLWAFAFIMICVYSFLSRNYFISAIALGLAAGSRITSILFLLPFIIFFYYNKIPFSRIILFLFTVLFTCILCYLPLLKKNNLSFLTFHDYTSYPSPLLILFKLYLAFGVLGGAALAFAAAALIRKRKLKRLGSASIRYIRTDLKLLFISIIILYMALFFRLPIESGYLIPLIPFGMIMGAEILKRKIFIGVMLLFVISPFLFSHSHGIYGLIFREEIIRKEMMSDAQWLLERSKKTKEKKVIVVGPLLPLIEYYRKGEPGSFIYTLEREELDSLKKAHCGIYYTDMGNQMNIQVTGINLFYYGKKLEPSH